ncbi:MAG: alpha/beta hydrolase, partial [Chloroflexota bacterium]
MKIFVVSIAILIIVGYIGICTYLYLNQENLIFYPTKLDPEYKYTFIHPFEESNLEVEGATINVVRFFSENPNGVVLYVHGNGDIIPSVEPIATYFLSL